MKSVYKFIVGVFVTITVIGLMFWRLGDCLIFGGCMKRLCPSFIRKIFRRLLW